MTSRRKFLGVSSLAIGASVLPSAAQPQSQSSSLPEPIRNLQSMKALAKPISGEERVQRQEKARSLMAANKLDAIVLMEGTSLVYFTGIRWWGGERMFAAVLPAKGEPFYVCPAFEEGRAREQIAGTPGGERADVRTWQEDENPYELLARTLNERGLATGKIGVAESVRYVFAEGLHKAASQAQFVSATPVTAGCRRIKSAHELELMKLANQATLRVYEAVYRSLHDGMTQDDVSALIDAAYARVGFAGDAMVEVGEFTAFPHGSTQPQIVREGVLVLLDDGCSVQGYQSDITRMLILVKPTDKMKRVFDTVHQAQSAALAAARPGVACGAVDAAARKVITDAGYGPDYKYFTHRVGHGIGMDGHEWPYLVRGNPTLLEPNMTFSDEPGVYIRGEFGIRLEDIMHITENGAELFTPQSPSLEDPFGKA
jgi:Xaa-Pro dipeptidase